MNLAQLNKPGRPTRMLFCGLTIALAGLLTGTAYTQQDGTQVSFVCDGGDRFSVEFHAEHVRLRNGAGVFSLAREPDSDGQRYSDGENVFWTDGTAAGFENARLQNKHRCRPATRDA